MSDNTVYLVTGANRGKQWFFWQLRAQLFSPRLSIAAQAITPAKSFLHCTSYLFASFPFAPIPLPTFHLTSHRTSSLPTARFNPRLSLPSTKPTPSLTSSPSRFPFTHRPRLRNNNPPPHPPPHHRYRHLPQARRLALLSVQHYPSDEHAGPLPPRRG